MDPGAIVAIVAILFVGAPAVIFRGLRSLRADRRATSPVASGEMRASELRTMIHDAVETATAPLAARITDLEERLGDEPVHAIRERVGSSARLDAPAMTVAFDAEEDLDDADGRPLHRRARA
ncbi:MAG TPA: hypothetical protein VF594_05250 [Rubricoccaceae bacterium]|jgi:hypothetical protein